MKNISDKNQTRIHFHNIVKHLSSDDRSRSVYCVVFYNSFYSLIAETDTINITRFVAAKSFEFTFVHKQTNITEKPFFKDGTLYSMKKTQYITGIYPEVIKVQSKRDTQ